MAQSGSILDAPILHSVIATNAKILKHDGGLYIHKSLLGHTSSLLVSKLQTKGKMHIYELIHNNVTGQKIILGTGKDATVREAIDLTSPDREHVAIKLHPFYKKKSAPREWRGREVSSELDQWQLSQKINSLLPNTFVNYRDGCIAGDKTTQKNPTHKLCYIITDKYEQTLDTYLAKLDTSLEDKKAILIKLFQKHRALYQNNFTYTDGNFCNVLLDKNLDVVFCDPIALYPHRLSDGMIGITIGVAMSLQHLFPEGDSSKNELTRNMRIISKFVTAIQICVTKPNLTFSENISIAVNQFFGATHGRITLKVALSLLYRDAD